MSAVELPAVVWVLTCDHRHGTDVSAHRSEADAIAASADWARQWWGEIDDSRDPATMTDADVSAAYWEYQSERGDEWHLISECPL